MAASIPMIRTIQERPALALALALGSSSNSYSSFTLFKFKTPTPLSCPQSYYLLRTRTPLVTTPHAKFRLSELLGGRGLCSGEEGLQKELQRADISQSPSPTIPPPSSSEAPPPDSPISDGAFEKELLGLTGGFPGGEKGLRRFIEENPPPLKKNTSPEEELKEGKKSIVGGRSKPKAPELPLLMPGMIVIVKNPKNPFYMYCGILQRITDGKAGVLFEGGNWDRLVTFNLHELERREKGPPMVNPKSAVLESLVNDSSA